MGEAIEILEIIYKHPRLNPRQIHSKRKLNVHDVGRILQTLRETNLVDTPERGIYVITELGKDVFEGLQEDWGTRFTRDELIAILGGKCEKCDTKKNLEIHHIDKNRDNNSRNNLKVLCKTCHHVGEHKRNPFNAQDLLRQLIENPGYTVAEYAGILGVATITVKITLGHLKALGFVEWVSPSRYEVTESGKDVLHQQLNVKEAEK